MEPLASRLMAAVRRGPRLVAAGVAALVTLGVTLGLALAYDASYESTAEVLIAPAGTSPELAAATSDTLSRGTVVTTYAIAFGSDTIADRALRVAGVSLGDRERVGVSSQAIAGTSVVRITAAAPDPDLARRAADAVARHRPSLAGYSEAFRPIVLESATAAERAGPSTGLLVVVALVLAAGAGAGAAWLVARASRRRGRARPAAEPEEAPESSLVEVARRSR